jgi:plastocyanin
VRKSAVFVVAIVAMCSLAVETPASAGPVQTHILAGPGGYVSAGTYYTPVVVSTRGGQITFDNYDVQPHNVVSTKKIGKGRAARPLFESRLLDFGESASVARVTKLRPGTYEFYCTLHPWMRGTLVVQSAPATPRAGAAR